MAIKGVSKPICAEYNHDGAGNVTYSNPYKADCAVEYGVEIESGEDNDLYADNKVKEQAAGTFSTAALTITTADMEPKLSMKIVGLKSVERDVGGAKIKEIVHDDDARAPYLGFGIIEEHQIDNITKYLPIVLAKIRFRDPNLAAKTREGEIEWQTKEITATVMRSDQVDENYNHPWQFSPEEMYDTEAGAEAYIMAVLGAAEQVTPQGDQNLEV
ncbi:MAG: hypothetical protein SOR93_03500 [Clostridiales Family XIII bacterium]|uniref:hypothetical protein n=1 Tax=Hominibacterium faecale TaxID=2839743 RepID=UPI0022B2A957|nr:hypothetical protein [Hominibacterium faecale]MCI7301835.1 phage tail protein [Clostridia bacterium]MDY3010312.1 hypothetical protein [Clostridiales Family XIII bacterium]